MSHSSRISVVAGALLLAASVAAPASASVFNLGPFDGALFLGDTIAASSAGPVSFTDDWTFQVAQPSETIDVQVYNANQPLSIKQQILGLTVALFVGTPGSGSLWVSSGSGNGTLGESVFTPTVTGTGGTDYYIEVTGTVPQKIDGAPQRGEYNLDPVISAVPEPATWAMMLIGFGMLGFRLRARGKAMAAA